MPTMPKHLAKGPYFDFMDNHYNNFGGRAALLARLRSEDPRNPGSPLPLAEVGSVEGKPNDASDDPALSPDQRIRARKNHLNWHWFGKHGDIVTPAGTGIPHPDNWPVRTPYTPPWPSTPPGLTTGWWINWGGEAENIMRCTLIRALEVAMGLTHNCPHHTPGVQAAGTRADPDRAFRQWPLDFFWVCGVTRFEGYVSWNHVQTPGQKARLWPPRWPVPGRRQSQVTVVFVTPGFPFNLEEFPQDNAMQLDGWATNRGPSKGIIYVGQHWDCSEPRYTEMVPGLVTHNLSIDRGGAGTWVGGQQPNRRCP